MNAVARVAMGFAVEHLDVVGDLKRDAIAVVVSGHTVANDGILRAIKVNGTAAAAIDVGIFSFVSVDDKIFKDDAVCLNGAEDWKGVANRSLLFFCVVVSQRHGIDAQQIALDRLDRGYRDIPTAIEQLVS